MLKYIKQGKRALCVLICFLAVTAVAGKDRSITYASDLTNDSIREKEAEINKAREEKKALQNGLTDIQALKKALEASKKELAS